MRRILTLVFFISCFSCTVSYSQNAKEDLLKMQQVYRNYPDVSMNITYKVFENHSSNDPMESETGKWCKHGNCQYADLFGMQTLLTKDNYVAIDTADKRLIVTDAPKTTNSITAIHDLENFINQGSEIKYFEPNSSQKGYKIQLVNDNSGYSSIEFLLNRKTYFIEKIVLFYDVEYSLVPGKEATSKPRLEILFSSINTNPTFPANLFDEKKYLERKDGKLVPGKKYSAYQLINQKKI